MKYLKKLFSRTSFMIIMVILEILLIASVFKWFGDQAAWIEIVLRILSVFIVLGIINNSKHLSADMLYILAIMISPVFGTAVYLLIRANLFTSSSLRSFVASNFSSFKYYKHDDSIMEEMKKIAPEHAGQFYYIASRAGYPFYHNTQTDYYGLGDTGYPIMLEEMKKARKFIFLEYFIIEEGKMWDGILEILEQKVKEGVEVRVLYDDLGSFFTLPGSYAKKLEEKGIKCIPFNKINPIIGIIANHRDHRKIMVIDGKVAFSGGINLADEYINAVVKCGHWKDNIIRIKGEAVWSYTLLFLTHWNSLRKEDADFTVFKAEPEKHESYDGFIAPYGESPLKNEKIAQNIYLNILNQAKDYCYIFTPYLIIDTDFINTLILAAERGVDVRIITPGIPDNKIIFNITQSYYSSLIEGGVKIFEYTPGYVHSKVFVSDDIIATVGTVNLDYRSLYLNFENGTYLFNSKTVKEIKADFDETLKQCHQVSREECRTGILKSLFVNIVKLFAPQM